MKEVKKEQLSSQLQKEIIKLEKNLKSLEENISLLQKGDEQGLYWNGENSLKTNKALQGHLNHNLVLLENLKKCSEHINSL